ncbi:MAG TPA: DUF1462 family protein [Herpetosiphonaceae bacterium]
MPSSEAAAALRQSLSRIYGPAIALRYYDLDDPQMQAAHAETLADLRDNRLPLPAIFLDGELIYAGAINLLRVVAAIGRAYQRQS